MAIGPLPNILERAALDTSGALAPGMKAAWANREAKSVPVGGDLGAVFVTAMGAAAASAL